MKSKMHHHDEDALHLLSFSSLLPPPSFTSVSICAVSLSNSPPIFILILADACLFELADNGDITGRKMHTCT